MRAPHAAHVLIAAVVITATSSAQTTWIVDSSNGPGTQFTNIDAAVAAAAPGDVILVRPGTGYYAGFSVETGVTILGAPTFSVARTGSVFATPVVSVGAVPAGQKLIIAHATLEDEVLVKNAKGHVHFQDVQFGTDLISWHTARGLYVDGSTDVTVQECSLPRGIPSLSAIQSDVTLVESTLSGTSGWLISILPGVPLGVYPQPGVRLTDSTLHVSRCDVTGGSQFLQPAQPAILATNSSITITGLATNVLQAGATSSALAAITADATSVVEVDPLVQLLGTSGGGPFGGGGTFVQRPIVSLDATGGTLGGTLTVEASSRQDDVVVILLGQPYPPTPSVLGALRVNLSSAVVLAQKVQPAAGLTQASLTIPNAVALRGLLLGLQAANWDHVTGVIEMSNAVDVVLQ